MTPIFVGLVALALTYSVFRHLHRVRGPELFLAVHSSTTIVRSHQMQIQANINTTQVFDVIVLGSQGENMTVPMDFTLSNPAVADAAFDPAAMTLTLTFKGLGTSDLIETAAGTHVSTTHQITVTDVVASVDLRAHVDETVLASETPVA